MCCRHYAAEYTPFGGGISGPFALLFNNNRLTKRYMTRRSGYDESNSPQWRYLLSRESEIKRQRRVSHHYRGEGNEMSALEEAENLFRTSSPDEGEVKRNRKNKKERQARTKEKNPKEQQNPIQKFTKSGKEILYSASPGRPPRKIMNTTITDNNDKN